MAAEEECECPECPKGLPAYLATFADLMSLLMCFFVLLLAFSEMDVKKYKQIAGSMKSAFGVQDEIQFENVPKGTSIIAQEFSPGRPDPTPINEIRQTTSETQHDTLEVLCSPGKSNQREDDADDAEVKADQSSQILERLIAMTQADAVEVAQTLQNDIQNGAVEVETKQRRIVIRVKEKGSFASGSATLQEDFIPIMDRVREALLEVEGNYSVEGHTDDIPIATARFRSNWELSSSRAVSVAHELMKDEVLAPERFTVVGHAETEPLVPNEDPASRARNRRVEIVIQQGQNDDQYLSGAVPLPDDPEFNMDSLKEAGLEDLDGFELMMEGPPPSAQQPNVISVMDDAEPEPGAGALPGNKPGNEPGNGPGTASEAGTAAAAAPAAGVPEATRNNPLATGQGNPFDMSVDPFAPAGDSREDEFF